MTTNHRKSYSVDTESRKGERVEAHESYGVIQISRTSGSTGKLFGSHLENQGHYFSLRIMQAEVIHDLSRDWYYPQDQIVEIHMTAAQFAEAITTHNSGSGVPCTIHRVLGDQMEPVPQQTETEAKKIRSEFKGKVRELAEKLVDGSKKVNDLLEKKSLSAADKETIRWVLGKAIQDVRDNLPFVVESFQESAEKIVTQAKAEVDAFLSLGVQRLGMEALQNRLESGQTVTKALKSGDE